MGQPERGSERDILRPQPLASFERGISDRDVFACRSHIGARFKARRENDPVVLIDAHILLHEHRVGSVGHRRAGEDPDGMTRLDRLSRRRTSLNASHYGEGRFLL